MLDETTGDMKAVKQKINEKNLPPNADIIKVIYNQLTNNDTDYSDYSDEELEKEKQRLINELKEKNDDSGNCKKKTKM